MNLETKDYKGKCRRKLSYNDILRIVGSCVVVIFISGGIAWQVKSLADDSKENKVVNKKQNESISLVNEHIAVIRNDITKMEVRQEKLEGNDEEQTKLLYEIKGLLSRDTSSIIELPWSPSN